MSMHRFEGSSGEVQKPISQTPQISQKKGRFNLNLGSRLKKIAGIIKNAYSNSDVPKGFKEYRGNFTNRRVGEIHIAKHREVEEETETEQLPEKPRESEGASKQRFHYTRRQEQNTRATRQVRTAKDTYVTSRRFLFQEKSVRPHQDVVIKQEKGPEKESARVSSPPTTRPETTSIKAKHHPDSSAPKTTSKSTSEALEKLKNERLRSDVLKAKKLECKAKIDALTEKAATLSSTPSFTTGKTMQDERAARNEKAAKFQGNKAKAALEARNEISNLNKQLEELNNQIYYASERVDKAKTDFSTANKQSPLSEMDKIQAQKDYLSKKKEITKKSKDRTGEHVKVRDEFSVYGGSYLTSEHESGLKSIESAESRLEDKVQHPESYVARGEKNLTSTQKKLEQARGNMTTVESKLEEAKRSKNTPEVVKLQRNLNSEQGRVSRLEGRVEGREKWLSRAKELASHKKETETTSSKPTASPEPKTTAESKASPAPKASAEPKASPAPKASPSPKPKSTPKPPS